MFIQILKERGLKSLINEIVDNYFYDIFNNVETRKRIGKSTKLYTYFEKKMMTYTMVNKSIFRFPTEQYLNIVKREYKDCKLDNKYLNNALKF